MPEQSWSVTVAFTEDADRTRADAILQLASQKFHGFGQAKRAPEDPTVPVIGQDLAAARALSDLSHHLLEGGRGANRVLRGTSRQIARLTQTARPTNTQNSRLLRVGRVLLLLSAGSGCAPCFCSTRSNTGNAVAFKTAVNTNRLLSARRRRFPQVLQDDEGGLRKAPDNRHEEGDERALRRRSSESRRP